MTEPFVSLRAHWSQHGLEPGPGVSEIELESFEASHNLRLPPEVRAYFATVNGVVGGRDGAWDGDMIAFWPLADARPFAALVPETRLPEADSYLAFADWSIDAWFYAARIPPDGVSAAPVYIVTGDQAERVAPSLEAFFERYMQGDDAVRYGARPPSDPPKGRSSRPT